jgi:DNA invertase Pin-like site-specific DNA recombinase
VLTAISYQRFSAINQSQGSTLDRQQRLINEWLSKNPDVQLSTLSEIDHAKSGFSGKHLDHGLGKILAAIESGDIKAGSYILVEAMDRIGRLAPLDMVSLVSGIVTAGVTLVTLEDNVHYTKELLNQDASSLFILVGKVQQAHSYSKNLSRRISAAYDRKRVSARAGEPIKLASPFWLGSDGKLIPDKAEAVKACINLYLLGRGTRRVLLDLLPEHEVLKPVHPRTLKRWFTNKALIGTWENKGEPINNVFEPLIEKATYYQLQAELKHKTKVMSPEKKYDLAGLVVCGQCGCNYSFRRKKYKDYVIEYANCSQYLKRGKVHCSNNTTWPMEVLKEIHDSTSWEVLEAAAEQTVDNEKLLELEALIAERDDINTQLEKLIDALISLPNQTNLTDRLARLNDGKNAVQARISRMEQGMTDGTATNPFHFSVAVEALQLDPVLCRDILQKRGYRITGEGKTMAVNDETYILIRRSQKEACYIVENKTPTKTTTLKIGRDGLLSSIET